MGVLAYGARHGTLMQQSRADDGGMGHDTSWVALGPVLMRLTTASSRIAMTYQRDGFENVVTVQCEDALPKRILGYTSLQALLLAIPEERMRINYRARTLSVIGVRMPNDGEIHGRRSVINIDCVETPQPVGIMDKA